MESKVFEEIKNENLNDDCGIMRIIWNDKISLETKKYVISNYSNRIADFDLIFTINFYTSLSFELCNCCSEFIKNSVETMDMDLLMKIFYIGDEPRKLSGIAAYLVTQDWFTTNMKYEMIKVAYDLMKYNNYNDEENNFNEKKLIDYGYYITGLLLKKECNVRAMNVILLNYLELMKKDYPWYFDTFIKEGYKKINAFIYSSIMLTQNMMIFDCHVTAKLLDIISFYYVDFDNSVDDFCYGSYGAGEITLDIDLIKKIYEECSSKIASLRSLHIIAHEIVHAEQDDYIYGIKQVEDKLAKLRIYNCFYSDYLRQVDDNLYSKNHDNFYIEYDANIRGMEILYRKYQFLPSLKDNEKDECSRIFAKGIFDSYKVFYKSNIRLSPIQFGRLNLKQHISDSSECLYDNDEEFNLVLKYRSSLLKDAECSFDISKKNINLSDDELLEIESNLTDYERFILGYDNPYLELLEMFTKGDVYLPYNILKSIPVFYEVNEEHIEKKYNFYKETAREREKVYEKMV